MERIIMNHYIDSTNLKMDATMKEIEALCHEAIHYHFETVCVHPYYVPFAKKLLEGSPVQVCTVIGFPLGMNTKQVKVYEAIEAINEGADEIDMVINVGALKDRDYDYIKDEIEEVRDAIDGKTLKVIVETSLLTTDELAKMTEICNETFVNFIKTSTGFGSRGASVADIKTIMEYRSDVLEVKASGGIRTAEQAQTLIDMGVTRIGTSHGKELMAMEPYHDRCHICTGTCEHEEGE